VGSSYSSGDILKILRDDGWYLIATKGDHHHLKHPTKPGKVTVPHPEKDLPLFLVKSIFKQAGLE
jgi:predicted RNA binding protein YcfA (HicA-like mRNA interferase family)